MIWTAGFVTDSLKVEVGVVTLTCAWTCSPRARRKQSYYCHSQDKIFRVWTQLNFTLALDQLP